MCEKPPPSALSALGLLSVMSATRGAGHWTPGCVLCVGSDCDLCIPGEKHSTVHSKLFLVTTTMPVGVIACVCAWRRVTWATEALNLHHIYRGEHVPLLRRNVMKTTLGLIFRLFLNFSVSFLPQIFQHVFDAFSASGRSSNTGPVHKNQSFHARRLFRQHVPNPPGSTVYPVKTGPKGEKISNRQGGADLRQTHGR